MQRRGYTLAELAQLTGSQIEGDPAYRIEGVAPLDEALPSDASFLANPRYKEEMRRSQAGVICIAPDAAREAGQRYLVSPDPSRAFQAIAEKILAPARSGFEGIHPTAVIHPSVQIGPNVQIGPYAVIDRDCRIGAHTRIGPHVSIGAEVEIGADCHLHPSVVVREQCRLGNRVIVQPGAVIGSCGFGYTTDAQGNHHKLEQLGIVILEDDVEIGANTTIDRSRFRTTLVRKGSKIDNLCQIAHNVEVGAHNLIAAQTGIAGSAKTGNWVMMGGQVGVLGHVEIADKTQIATRSGVSKSLPSGVYRGSPAIPFADYQRQEVHVRKLSQYVERLKAVERALASAPSPDPLS
jgi:UDP-3-O-[3-hydroxymyristoyl] glucosamine N-acyltransferase